MNKLIVRSTLFPINYLDHYNKSSNEIEFILDFFKKSAIFRESVYLNSETLFKRAIVSGDMEMSEKDRHRIALSLIKYFKRMCYRSTPFGLSANIGIGIFGHSDIPDKFQLARKKSFDGSYIRSLAESLKNETDLRNITIYSNNTCYIKKGKIRYIERKYNAGNQAYYFNLVKADHMSEIEELLILAENGTRYSELHDHLKLKGYSSEEIDYFIHDLINSQLLLSELDFMTTANELERVIKAIGKGEISPVTALQEKITQLGKAMELLHEVVSENTSDESVSCYSEIKKITKIDNSEDYVIKVDTIRTSSTVIDPVILSDVRRVLGKLQVIDNCIFSGNELSLFKDKFYSRYGDQFIPVLEVLDPEIGIGFPIGNNSSKSSLLNQVQFDSEQYNPVSLSLWDSFILKKYTAHLKNGNEGELKITTEDIDTLKSKTGTVREIDYGIVNVIPYKMKDGALVYDLISAGDKILADAFSRFAGYSEEMSSYWDELSTIIKGYNDKDEDTIYAEIIHSSQPRLVNISAQKELVGYFIPVYDVPESTSGIKIALKNLYVGFSGNKLILYDAKLKKRIIPILPSAQNYSLLTNSIFHFISLFQNKRYLESWNWGVFTGQNHFPRVTIDNFIVFKQSWRIRIEEFGKHKEKITLKGLAEGLLSRKIPTSVTLTSTDNVMPLNLEKNFDLHILHQELQKREFVVLQEQLLNEQTEAYLNCIDGKRTCELQIPILNPFHLPVMDGISNTLIAKRIKKNTNNLVKRVLLHGDDCIYFKIYCNPGNSDNIICHHLKKLLDKLTGQQLIDSFFFIRYQDPDYHIRVRCFKKDIESSKIITLINSEFRKAFELGLIMKTSYEQYDREIERYGNENMVVTESLFFYESSFIINAIQLYYSHHLREDLWTIAVLGIDFLFDIFKLSIEERVKVLTTCRDYYLYVLKIKSRKSYNKSASIFYKQHAAQIDCYLKREISDPKLKKLNIEMKKWHRSVTALDNRSLMKCKINIDSYIHMFCNRIYDSSQNVQECITYDLLILYYREKTKRKS
ncbi:lantibiotic dehydratase [Pedobacter sp. WC2423]|uniref:lantibiotic dehydratase n=1 Tax=Pedobacter sp. WC2423 TaxID=3234142 RepID=UPI003467EB60